MCREHFDQWEYFDCENMTQMKCEIESLISNFKNVRDQYNKCYDRCGVKEQHFVSHGGKLCVSVRIGHLDDNNDMRLYVRK